jgi:PAS domain S-box-containing protein
MEGDPNMKDEARNKKDLIDELISLRLKVSKLKESQNKLRQTASELRKAEERFAMLSIATSDAIHDWDLAKNQLWCNEGMQKTLTVREVIHDPWDWWLKIIHPDDRVRMVSGMQRLMKSNRKFGSNEYRIQTADGNTVYINHRIYILRDSKEKPVRIMGAATNITERKRSEEALRESEEQYRSFFETSRDCVFISSAEGRWLDLNDAAVELFGYASKEELKKVSIRELYADPEGRDRFIGQMREKGHVKEYPFDMRKKDGSIIHTLLTSVAWKDPEGNILGYRGTIRDVTNKRRVERELKAKHEELSAAYGQLSAYGDELHRKYYELLESQQALHESDTRYRAMFQNMGSGVAVYETRDNGDTFIFKDFNRAAEEIENFKREELIGRSVTDVFPVAKEFGICDVLQRVWRTGVPEHHPVTLYNDERLSSWRENFVYRLPTGEIVAIYDDVTERRQAEKALKESEEKLKNILEAVQAGIVIIDPETHRIVDVNPLAAKIINAPRNQIIGSVCHKFICPAEVGKCPISDLHQPVDNAERVLLSADGRKFSIIKTVVPVMIEGRKYILESFIDITERKHAEELLRESEKRYRELTDFLPISIFEVDTEGNVISFNRTALEVFMYNQEDYKEGMNALQFLAPAEWQRAGENIVRVVRGTSVTGQEYTFLRKDGSTFTGLIYASPNIHQNEPVGIRGTIIDITERKQTEEALRQSEEKYRAIIENMEEGYIEVDLRGRLTFFNEAARKFLGYSKDETMGMHYKKYVDEEHARKIFEAYNGVYKTGVFLPLFEWEVIRKDGARRTVEGSASLITDAAARPVGFRGLFRDITDRKRMQDEHKQLQERLQRAEKMEALGALAGGVAHDLNNVLGVLVGYSELLLQNLPQDSPLQRHALQIFKGGERAAAIIQDLLTLTRRGVLVSEALNLNRVISDFLQMPEFEAIKSHHPGVQFKTSLDADLLNIKGSSTHLSKTVMNLLSNAAEAISGSGEVLIRTENRYMDRPIHGYDTTQEGEYAVLTVSDTGSGISSADLGRIFEPFYTKKVMGRSGTGLGLAVVWGTVKDHDGYIDVRSTAGEGSIFTLYFPVTREDLTKGEQVVPQSTYLGRGEHILVVDDVEGQRLLASAMLEGLGYKVCTVANGIEAVEFVAKEPVDLLVLDMIMDPGIDGLETYRRILEIRRDQKAIIVSGFAMTERVRQTQKLGAGAYVKKPYLLEKIGIAVRRELDK